MATAVLNVVPRKLTPVRYSALRLLIFLFVMGDVIRRIFSGHGFFDWMVLAIDIGILVFVVMEYVRNSKDRRIAKAERQEYEQYLQRKIESLTSEEKAGLRMILKGGQPHLDVTVSLRNKIYGLVIQSPVSSILEIPPEHRSYLRRWAEKQP